MGRYSLFAKCSDFTVVIQCEIMQDCFSGLGFIPAQ